MPKQIVDLNSLAGGAVLERFNTELQKVLENIADPNTDAKKARKLTLTVSLTGNEKRNVSDVSIQTKTTLVAANNIETHIVMDYDTKGKVTGAELKSGSVGQIFITENNEVADDTGNIIDLKQAAKGGK